MNTELPEIGACYEATMREIVYETPLIPSNGPTIEDEIDRLSIGDIFIVLDQVPVNSNNPSISCTDNFKIFFNNKIGWIVIRQDKITKMFGIKVT